MTGIGYEHKKTSARVSFGKDDYTTGEVAEIVGVSTDTLKNWEKAGKIPAPDRDYKKARVWTKEHLQIVLRHRR